MSFVLALQPVTLPISSTQVDLVFDAGSIHQRIGYPGALSAVNTGYRGGGENADDSDHDHQFGEGGVG